MDVWNNIAILALPFLLILVKDVIPYLIRRYAAKEKNGHYNAEILEDINKDILVSIVRFPSDLIIASSGYSLSRIILFSKTIDQLLQYGTSQNLLQDVTQLTFMLNKSHALFWSTLLALLPVCVTVTRKCETLIYPRHDEKPKKVKAWCFTTLVYILVIGFNIKILFF